MLEQLVCRAEYLAILFSARLLVLVGCVSTSWTDHKSQHIRSYLYCNDTHIKNYQY